MGKWVWVSIACIGRHRQADPRSFLTIQPCGKSELLFQWQRGPVLRQQAQFYSGLQMCEWVHTPTHASTCVHTEMYTTHTTHGIHRTHFRKRSKYRFQLIIAIKLSHWLTSDCVQSAPLRAVYFRIWCHRAPELESQYTQVGLKNHSHPLGSASRMRLQL